MGAARDILYYDGDCPICSRYRDYVAVRPGLDLRDAREYVDEMLRLRDEGFDINAGMILVTPDRTLQGADVIVELDRRAGRRATPAWLTRASYPLLRGIRHVLLRALGRDPRITP
jgi:predicted DCC family thiol-disulfide oxidoreductase YuxK